MSGDPTGGPWLLLEGGGSQTSIAVTVATPTQLAGPSTNPRSVGEELAAENLQRLLDGILVAANIPAAEIHGVVAAHGGASVHSACERLADLISHAQRRMGIRAPLCVTNDMVPALLTIDADAVLSAVAGTGTGFAARRGLRRWARASGLDYLLSDDGGGFDLGMRGLRAVVAALDGRGPATVLTDRARAWCPPAGHDRLGEDLFDYVYGLRHKPVVASFARCVLDACDDGDAIAALLVADAAGHLARGLQAVARRADLTNHPLTVLLSGSLLAPSSPLHAALLPAVHQAFDVSVIVYHDQAQHPDALRRLGTWAQQPGSPLDAIGAIFPVSRRAP